MTISLHTAERAVLLKRATYASVAVACILIAAKLYAWIATGSVSMQATLMDSVLDAATSLVNLFAVRHSLRPADHDHRFGHGKIEAIAGLGQAAFITGSALLIFLEAARRLITPAPVSHSQLGIWIMVFSIIMTFLLVGYQRRVVRETSSTAIAADSLHYECDLLVNAGVLVSLLLTQWLQWRSVDPLFGAAIALYILNTARKVMKDAVDILMDRELPDTDRDTIIRIVCSHKEVLGLHDLRTRSTGAQQFIQLHLELPPEVSLAEGNRISHEVEKLIHQTFPAAEVLIHQDIFHGNRGHARL